MKSQETDILDALARQPAPCRCGLSSHYPAKVNAMVNGYERIITFMSGYICTITGPQSHGRHGMDMLFLLRKKDIGAVQFVVYTGWEPDWDGTGGLFGPKLHGPLPADLGFHSLKEMYFGQTKRDDCPWLDGMPCYYDGSGLNARTAFKVFVSKGEEALWTYLEYYFESTFK